MSTTTKPGFLQPALIGGAVMGTLSALPFINLGNCCCLWLIGGGVVAAYVLQQNQEAPITPGDGALAGLFAGIVGAFIFLVLSIPIVIVMAPMQRAMTERIINESPTHLTACDLRQKRGIVPFCVGSSPTEKLLHFLGLSSLRL